MLTRRTSFLFEQTLHYNLLYLTKILLLNSKRVPALAWKRNQIYRNMEEIADKFCLQFISQTPYEVIQCEGPFFPQFHHPIEVLTAKPHEQRGVVVQN